MKHEVKCGVDPSHRVFDTTDSDGVDNIYFCLDCQKEVVVQPEEVDSLHS